MFIVLMFMNVNKFDICEISNLKIGLDYLLL